LSIPADRQYTRDHEWLRADGATARVGITEYAAEALGDIVYLDLPAVGTRISAGASCGEIESTKSVSDLIAPVTGTVTAHNDDVVAAPENVNADPWSAWLYEVSVEAEGDLLSADEYSAFVEGLEA